MSSKDIIACICEGSAEKAIIERLLEWDCLIFSRDDLLEREILDSRYRSPKHFENDFLSKSFDGSKITVYRILDSKKQASNFKLSKEYQRYLDVVNAITSPEIEMMYIISEGCFDDYSRKFKAGPKKLKPSEYVKTKLNTKNIKKFSFWYDYYDDKTKLLTALHKYAKGRSRTIYDLVKYECKNTLI